MRIKGWAIVIAGSLAVLALLSLNTGYFWDGGFGQVECRLTFKDSNGKGIPNVELRVENEQGNNFDYYPVTDYALTDIPTSDSDGVLTFHHIRLSALEFGGKCSHLFWIIPVGQCDSPVFVCRFLKDGKEIHKCRFNDLLASAYKSQRKVMRTWDWNSRLPFSSDSDAAETWFAKEYENRNKSGGAIRSFEDGVALNAMSSFVDQGDAIRHGRVSANEELEFLQVDATITVGQP
jgi:hypothetical protein